MEIQYAREKFNAAIDGMATSTKSIQQRVADAYASNLIQLNEEDLPESIQQKFSLFSRRISASKAVGGEGTVAATMSEMTESEAVEMAQEIISMADVIRASAKG